MAKSAKLQAKIDTTLKSVTDRLISELESGNATKWVKTWVPTGEDTPHNPVSGAVYRGFNWFHLSLVREEAGYSSGRWATYRQWKSRKAQVKRNQQGTLILRVSVWTVHGDDDPKKDCSSYRERQERGCFIRKTVSGHYVFNADQVEGSDNVPTLPGFSKGAVRAEADDQDIVDLFSATGARIVLGGDRAFHRQGSNQVNVPKPETFRTRGGFATTLAHELIHWTGDPNRLDRTKGSQFGDAEYAFEELIAELGAVVTTSALGLETEAFTNHAAYLGSWLKGLRTEEGPRHLLRVAGAASKAATYLIERVEAEASAPLAIAA